MSKSGGTNTRIRCTSGRSRPLPRGRNSLFTTALTIGKSIISTAPSRYNWKPPSAMHWWHWRGSVSKPKSYDPSARPAKHTKSGDTGFSVHARDRPLPRPLAAQAANCAHTSVLCSPSPTSCRPVPPHPALLHRTPAPLPYPRLCLTGFPPHTQTSPRPPRSRPLGTRPLPSYGLWISTGQSSTTCYKRRGASQL